MTSASVATVLVFFGCAFLRAAGPREESERNPASAPQEASADAPSEKHRLLEPFLGTFDTELTFFPPGGPPVTSKGGTMVNTWVMDGRFLKQEFEGTFAGAPFRGIGYWGYSNKDRAFESTWIDNFSTGIAFRGEGQVSEDGKVFTTVYSDTDGAGGPTRRHKDVVRLLDRDRHTWTSSVIGESGEGKRMEVIYTRRKGVR